MKAAPFAYARPSSVDDAVAELARADGEGKVLAGGQSLVPVLAMRLARPSVLVDINAVAGLGELALSGDALEVGATVRQRQVEHDQRAASVPLLGLALPWVGHRELRSRGTVCGSLAHADPAAELPAVAACLDATLEAAGPSGRRTLRAREFFAGAMTTQLEAEELLIRASFPVAGPGEGFGFAEFARQHGDFALAGVAVRVRRSPREAVLAAFGVSDRPVVRDVTGLLDGLGDLDGDGADNADADNADVGRADVGRADVGRADVGRADVGRADVGRADVGRADVDRADVDRIAAALAEPMAGLAAEIVDTGGDVHASPGYRRRLLAALAARELAGALVRARAAPDPAGRRTPPPEGRR